MKHYAKKIISVCLAAVIVVITVGYAPPLVGNAELSKSQMEEVVQGSASPSQATPYEVENPEYTATPSEAESSGEKSTPSEAVKEFIRMVPEEVPDYYNRTSKAGKRFWKFEDRNGEIQYRIYGYFQGDVDFPQWFKTDDTGAEDREQPINLNEEYYDLAPYLVKSVEPTSYDWTSLSELLGTSTVIQESETRLFSVIGKNYDETTFDIWDVWYKDEILGKSNNNLFCFGTIINSNDKENSWYFADSNGTLQKRVTPKMDLSYIMPSFMRIASSKYTTWFETSYYDYLPKKYEDTNFYKNWKTMYPNNKAYTFEVWGSLKTITPSNNDILIVKMSNPAEYSGYPGNIGENYLYGPAGSQVGYLGQPPLWDGSYRGFLGILIDANCNGTWRLHRDGYYTDDEDGRSHNRNGENTIKVSGVNPIVNFYDSYGNLIKSQTVTYGGSASEPVRPTRIGYIFNGWDKLITNVTTNLDVTATYRPVSYSISYNGNGAAGGSTASSSHSYDTAKLLSANGFTRPYYTFKNWNTKADGSGTAYSNNQSVSNLTASQGATITLYAQWARSSSLVTYKNYDGSTLKTQEVGFGAAATPPVVPTRAGYTFTGWDKSSSNIQDHTTITAQYSINNYTLTLDGNGGTVDGSFSKVESVIYQDSFDQLLTAGWGAAFRIGYTFDGWYSGKEGGSAYSDSGNIMPDESLTIYAHWIPNTYEVLFDPDHVRWTEGTFKEDYAFDTKLGTLPAPEIYGWKLLGWWTGRNGTGEKITEISDIGPKNVTYYGNWEPGMYQIRFLSEVDQPSGKSVQTFPAEQTFDSVLGELPNPEETGYTFDGWYDGDEKVIPETVFLPSSDAEGYTYHASWDANAYHIRLLGNHYGLDPVVSEFDRTYYTRIGSLPEPEVPGYTFLGWFDEDENEITPESWVKARAVNYQAHWKVNKYTVSFDKNLYAVEKNPDSKTVTYDETLGKLPVLSADGYTFTGWYTESEDGYLVEEDTPVAIGDQTYYAHWNHNSYILTLITDKATSIINEITVIYDRVLGDLPIPELEDFSFRGWYLKPYTNEEATPSQAKQKNVATPSTAKFKEGILKDTATPNEALRIDENTIYKTATISKAYAYFDLVYREEEGNKNRRSGKDGVLDTEDDNFYFNGQDQTSGTSDDRKILPGADGKYGTTDDYYEFPGGYVYPGLDGVFGTPDDYLDLFDGTNLRLQESDWWDDTGTLMVNNGADKKPGTMDDWIWESKTLHTIRKSGKDGIFFTKDDKVWWTGRDGIPGTEDDQPIYGGTGYIDNGNGTNTRAGADGIWGTEDDELWQNGPDGIAGNQDDYQHKNQDLSGTDALRVGSKNSDEDEGWAYDATKNVWNYYYFSNKNIVSSWAYLIYNGVKEWYYFDEKGNMLTGWYEAENGKKYYLHEISDGTKGHMYRGWNEIVGIWYYFDESEGSLVTGTVTPDGYTVDETGVWTEK